MGHMEDVPCHIAVFHRGVWRGHDSPAITKQFYHFAKLYATNQRSVSRDEYELACKSANCEDSKV